MLVPNLAHYVHIAVSLSSECKRCNKLCKAEDIEHNDNSAGWVVEGFEKRQWLWFECSSCGCQTSFEKLQIPGQLSGEESLILQDKEVKKIRARIQEEQMKETKRIRALFKL